MTTLTVPATPARLVPGWWVTARPFILFQLQVAAWTFAIIGLGTAGVVAIVSRFITISRSAVQFLTQASLWAGFGTFVGLLALFMTAFLAAGLTRRDILAGAGVTAAVTAGVHTAAWMALLSAEKLIYDRLGWRHMYPSVSNEPVPIDARFALGMFLLLAAAFTSATLVAVTAYRAKTMTMLLSIPATMTPVAWTAFVIMASTSDWNIGGIALAHIALPVRLGTVLVVLAAAWWAAYLLIRRLRVGAKGA